MLLQVLLPSPLSLLLSSVALPQAGVNYVVPINSIVQTPSFLFSGYRVCHTRSRQSGMPRQRLENTTSVKSRQQTIINYILIISFIRYKMFGLMLPRVLLTSLLSLRSSTVLLQAGVS